MEFENVLTELTDRLTRIAIGVGMTPKEIDTPSQIDSIDLDYLQISLNENIPDRTPFDREYDLTLFAYSMSQSKVTALTLAIQSEASRSSLLVSVFEREKFYDDRLGLWVIMLSLKIST